MPFFMYNEKVGVGAPCKRDFPRWQTVYGYLRLWQKMGIWQQVHDQLREQVRQAVDKAAGPSAAIIDSLSVKTTEKRGKSTVTTSAKHVKGRKRFARF